MKKLLIATMLVGATQAMANGIDGGLSSAITSETSSASSSSKYNKEVLMMAQEDAKMFVENQGEIEVSEALRAAIDEVNRVLFAAYGESVTDLEAATIILYNNAVRAQ